MQAFNDKRGKNNSSKNSKNSENDKNKNKNNTRSGMEKEEEQFADHKMSSSAYSRFGFVEWGEESKATSVVGSSSPRNNTNTNTNTNTNMNTNNTFYVVNGRRINFISDATPEAG